MDIIPAIDLREGACARVFGEMSPADIYTDDPLEQAVIFKQLGAKQIHITDLDGSFSGHLCNLRVIQEMVELSGLDIQLSGGVRSLADIDTLINLGVEHVVVGVHFLNNHELIKRAYAKYGRQQTGGREGTVGFGFLYFPGNVAGMAGRIG